MPMLILCSCACVGELGLGRRPVSSRRTTGAGGTGMHFAYTATRLVVLHATQISTTRSLYILSIHTLLVLRAGE